MGFNRRKMDDERRREAEKQATAKPPKLAELIGHRFESGR
jgi:hypothetical protein